MRIFPNPAQEQVWIEIEGAAPRGVIYITDLMGKRIYQQSVSGSTNEVSLNGIASGTYLLQVKTSGQVIRSKLVIK